MPTDEFGNQWGVWFHYEDGSKDGVWRLSIIVVEAYNAEVQPQGANLISGCFDDLPPTPLQDSIFGSFFNGTTPFQLAALAHALYIAGATGTRYGIADDYAVEGLVEGPLATVGSGISPSRAISLIHSFALSAEPNTLAACALPPLSEPKVM